MYDRFGGEDKCVQFWNALHHSELDFKTKEMLWKAGNKGLVTRTELYQWKLSDSSKCHLCNNSDETLHHLFVDCNKTKDFVKFVFELIGADLNIDNRFVVGSNFDVVSYSQFYFLCMTKRVIWNARNLKAMKDVPVTVNGLKADFNRRVSVHLQSLLIRQEIKGKLEKFCKLYIKDHDWCNIANKKIVTNF